ncbi:molybdopterin molybdotransferase MoeA [Paucibacter sp. R3-3]|uniref:Molybdopterin molybdenumtransferase n=1 Tax=Roseateles agri TaxID=3098619 RepID=A0ABU5DPG3_9BURK|nr:gephyrin-like molybdotransferase Glp [Paucibacter sp. R3-3]MDY0748205.1 molybdopterin molybdotransferase MoeA [Paucibacter sp. R3-3]
MTNALSDIASCLAGYDPDSMPVPLAQDFIARLLPRPAQRESVGLRESLGRVLAEDLVCGINVPAHDNSAMDGYALRGSELQTGEPTRLALAGTSLAGSAAAIEIATGQCQRIMTGAVMPAGLDTVVPQEFVELDGDTIVIPAGAVQPGANRRLAGEDLARGQVALPAGRRLTPADLGLIASLGRAEVPVWRRLRVAIMATGDELRPVGEPLPPGCVYDSNRHTMWAMLQRLGVCEVIDLGVIPDDPAALREAFRRAAAETDVVLSSGGVSVGEADHTKAVMAELGEVLFWKIAMRPGRPLAVGRLGDALLFGMPGNPVAVMVSFYAFVRDALLAMSGAMPAPLPLLRAATTAPLRKKPGRTEYQRGIVSRRAADGAWQVEITGSQGSGVLSSMSLANGLLVLGHEQGDLPAGSLVDVVPFEGLI